MNIKTFSEFNNSRNLNESSINRLISKMDKQNCVILSAFRSKFGCATENDLVMPYSINMQNHRELKSLILQFGYQFTEVDGMYIEGYGSEGAYPSGEKSVFVTSPNENKDILTDMFKLAQIYKQDSVAYIPYQTDEEIKRDGQISFLVGTSDCGDAYPGLYNVKLNDTQLFGREGYPFYTTVKNRPMTFIKSKKYDRHIIVSEYLKDRYFPTDLPFNLKGFDE
jgi:hypothetical protein